MIMDLTIRNLLCFKKVAELEHMTKAADELYISQAQLSRIISDLENQFGVRFFWREGKGIKLNACGRAFYEYTLQSLELTDKVRKKVREIYLHEQAQVTITSNCGAYMPGILRALLSSSPEIKFRESEVIRELCVSSLKEGVSDFSICCPPIEDLDITSTVLIKETGAVIYPKEHWLRERKSVSLFELANEKFIGQMKGYGDRDSFDEECRRLNFEPDYVVETGEAFQITRLVAEGLGIALVPRSVLNDSIPYVDIEEPLSGSVALSWRKDRKLNDTDRLFMGVIGEYFKRLEQWAVEITK